MKKSIKFVVTVSIIFCSLLCNAQHRLIPAAEYLKLQKEDIKNTVYIFEGTVIQRSIKGEKLCSVIQITKIFKGSPQLKLGTIKVITEQNRNTQDGDPGLGRGRYIIFGKSIDSSPFQSTVTDNTITLTTTDLSVAIFGKVENGHPAAEWGQAKYKTVDSLYSFFKENGLTVQEEVQQK